MAGETEITLVEVVEGVGIIVVPAPEPDPIAVAVVVEDSQFAVVVSETTGGGGNMYLADYDPDQDGSVEEADHAASADSVLWTGVTGKPTTYPPETHNHDATYESKNTNIQGHISSTSNPHGTTKAQVGLGNCDNTSDADKPVSTDQQTALDSKISHSLATAANDFLVASGIGVFVKKTLAEVKTILGLGSAAYTDSTAYEPVNANIQTHIASTSNPHGTTKAQVGLGNCDNTSDADKPVSTAQQTALDGKISHSLATAANDFLVASGIGVFVKKTLAEVKTILGLGSAAYTNSTAYAPVAKGVTNGDSHGHVGGDGAPIVKTVAKGINIDGAGTVLTTGSKGFLTIPAAATIVGWQLISKESGSIVIDVKKCAHANFPTTSSICGSAKPTLSSAQINHDEALTGWTTSISAGDILEFVVDSASTVTRATLTLHLQI